jgi:hypothetical protein
MIEKRKHVVARMVHRPEFDASEMWFEDGMAVAVRRCDMDRALRSAGLANMVTLITGATAELELVDGRWVLATLQLPKGASQ